VSGRVAGVGWHDVYVRWDISTPQAVVSRLDEAPGQGSIRRPGKKLFAERDRFGKWQHLLGPDHVLLAYVVESPPHGLIRRLELQAHLVEVGEDDLCEPEEFVARWQRVERFMAVRGVLPPEDPVYVRVDPAVDVVYDNPRDGWEVLEGLRYARWPYAWYAQFEGPPPHTTVSVKKGTKTVARAYCRNTKLRNGNPRWGKLRFERERRFEWREQRRLGELADTETAAAYWGSAFGYGAAAGKVTRIKREVQTVKLSERVQVGEITTQKYEQLCGFLDAERLGITDRIYNPETARRRRKLARELGVSIADSQSEPLDVSLDELLVVPRAAWGS
jgi:hypothetical protein